MATSMLSTPFYSGRYGYKMYFHLYIMGDGIGKGMHLSLFFVVMNGEFDNILQSVTSLCDNVAVVEIINWGNSQDQDVTHFMRCLAFIQAKFCFSIRASHIKGSNNDLADALSRDNRDYFLSNYPQASPMPTPLPQELLDLTIIAKPDWTSAHWTSLWSGIFKWLSSIKPELL